MGDMVGVGGEGKLRSGGTFHRYDFAPRVILVACNQGRVIALGFGIVASIDGYFLTK